MAFDEQVIVRAPGRVNLIGDHTDYTGGLVLPMVVDLHTTIVGTHGDGDSWHLTSDTHGSATIPLDTKRALEIESDWARYVAGVLSELLGRGIRIRGFTGTVSTSLPIGGGLSSSAALEVAAARLALSGSDGADIDDVELARLCQRAEHIATGVPCGIMDQLSIVAGRQGSATLIDCSSLEITRVPIPSELVVEHRFISPRTLAGSEYSSRVEECERIENQIGPLRTASIDDVESLDSDVLRRRARHVISENSRVRAFADALARHEFSEAGRLMTESHYSLAEDYGTSTPEMDAAVESARRERGVLGARMTGGGFGGCIVLLRHR